MNSHLSAPPPESPLPEKRQKEILLEFCKFSSEVWVQFELYRSLFENGEEQLQLFDRVAPHLFHDLAGILSSNLFLQFCKLTDPAKTKKDSNLTTNFILEQFLWPEAVKQQLVIVNNQLMEFRNLIVDARNKRVGHVDLAAQVDQKENLGEFPKGDDQRFMENLQAFVDIAYGYLFGDLFIIRAPLAPDTYCLVRALEAATAYNDCTRCTAGERAETVLDRRT